jgi:two-component system response regulator (stage 0 sporulation protein F)
MEGDMEKILLAFDDYAISMFYEEELSEEGYEVIVSDAPQYLMETIAEENPAVVLLDTDIRGLSGLDMLWDIRNRYYDIPVILCPTYPENRYDSRAFAADYFVMHRSDLSELKRIIKLVLKGDTHLGHNAMRTFEKAQTY